MGSNQGQAERKVDAPPDTSHLVFVSAQEIIDQLPKLKLDELRLVKQQVEDLEAKSAKKESNMPDPYGFLKVLQDANFDGPPDWSSKLDDYLWHHDRTRNDDPGN